MSLGISHLYANVLGNYRYGGNTIGTDKQYGAWYNQLYGSKKTSSISASDFDYKAQQARLKEALSKYKENSGKLQTLKKDSADFLTAYTDKMTSMDGAAKAVQGRNFDKLVGDVSSGELTEEAMKKTTDAVQNMVNAYNDALDTLSDNAGRGSGVARQLDRMSRSPEAEASMKLIGITRGENGKLSLNQDQLTSALSLAAAGDARVGNTARMDLIKDIVSGGIASGIRDNAQAALNTPANTLISNDLAEMQNQQSPVNMNHIYTRSGAQGMMDMGVAGLLMNLSA